MAHNSSLLLMALLIFISLASLGRSQEGAIEGRAFCSPTGNPDPNSQPLPLANITVNLEYNGDVFGESVTNATGFFSFSTEEIIDQFFNSLSDTLPLAVIKLPVPTCDSLPESGSIQAPIYVTKLINFVFTFVIGEFAFIGA